MSRGLKALRDRVGRWADEAHDDLNAEERDAPYTDGNFDSFNGWHRTVDKKRDALLKRLGKANDARSRATWIAIERSSKAS